MTFWNTYMYLYFIGWDILSWICGNLSTSLCDGLLNLCYIQVCIAVWNLKGQKNHLDKTALRSNYALEY